jgi:hypothetical protein
MGIVEATRAYEAYLSRQLGDALVRDDLCTKHESMAEKPFPFLRATYYRWAEEILNVCPDLAGAPPVVAIGDIHLENFGTWRDNDGRLIWGVNDFDEAAEMPYALDLVRLGVSAVLGCPQIGSPRAISDSILKGYKRGLADPHPIVLDDQYTWLRDALVVKTRKRTKFWEDMENLVAAAEKNRKKPSKDYVGALAAAMPEPVRDLKYGERTGAGLGSLGRPRWIGRAQWRGGLVVREAKAALPSAWTLPKGRPEQPMYCFKIATASYRAPDPWYRLVGDIVVRRLSPNNRKLDSAKDSRGIMNKKMLRLMGRELAAVHLGIKDHRETVEHDIGARHARDPDWLHSAIKSAANFISREYEEWKKSRKSRK